MDRIEVMASGGRYTADRDGMMTQIRFPLRLDYIAPQVFHTGERLGENAAGMVVMAIDLVLAEVRKRIVPITWRPIPRR